MKALRLRGIRTHQDWIEVDLTGEERDIAVAAGEAAAGEYLGRFCHPSRIHVRAPNGGRLGGAAAKESAIRKRKEVKVAMIVAIMKHRDPDWQSPEEIRKKEALERRELQDRVDAVCRKVRILDAADFDRVEHFMALLLVGVPEELASDEGTG